MLISYSPPLNVWRLHFVRSCLSSLAHTGLIPPNIYLPHPYLQLRTQTLHRSLTLRLELRCRCASPPPYLQYLNIPYLLRDLVRPRASVQGILYQLTQTHSPSFRYLSLAPEPHTHQPTEPIFRMQPPFWVGSSALGNIPHCAVSVISQRGPIFVKPAPGKSSNAHSRLVWKQRALGPL